VLLQVAQRLLGIVATDNAQIRLLKYALGEVTGFLLILDDEGDAARRRTILGMGRALGPVHPSHQGGEMVGQPLRYEVVVA
jgi:hypothetical protein